MTGLEWLAANKLHKINDFQFTLKRDRLKRLNLNDLLELYAVEEHYSHITDWSKPFDPILPTCPICKGHQLKLVQNPKLGLFVFCRTPGCHSFPVRAV